MSFILMCLTVAIAFTQCKKEQPSTPENESNSIIITLDVNQGGNVSKGNVDPPHVTFENGDIIYVASNGTYIGTLEYDGNHFVGLITDPTEGQPLHFFFLGNQNLSLTTGTTTFCYVNISDQTSKLPVISYAPSNENYTSSTTAYTAILRNQCALVKFNVSTPSNAAICIQDFNNRVKIDFSTNSFTYSKINNGIIKLAGGNGENVEKWAILFPQDALVEGLVGSTYSFDGEYSGTRPFIPAIVRNAYLPNGIDLTINTSCVPTGALRGLYSVSATKQVYFSRGNLRYCPGSKLWRFAYPQYGLLHTGFTGDSNVTSEYTSTFINWIDMFGWATSGINHGATCYQPYSTNQTDSYYSAYGNQTYNLYDRYGAADWGYNRIADGGDQTNLWRTPTHTEWSYVLTGRDTPSGIRFAKAVINDVKGIILLPDHWDASIYPLNNTNNTSANYSNSITEDDWQTYFEANGAVFLPAAGWRDYINVIQSTEYYGYYWASDRPTVGYNPNNSMVYCLKFNNSLLSTTNRSKHYGSSVRLIQDRVQE